ncbi:MAG TPA: hypothetical protein VF868_06305 [Bacteroidia bacterium]|jgi:hypothetical protein
MNTQIITLSKNTTILKCCIVALIIASLISLSGKVTLQEFISNIMEWESM